MMADAVFQAAHRLPDPKRQEGLGFRDWPPNHACWVTLGVIFGQYRGYIGILEKKMETTMTASHNPKPTPRSLSR